MLRIEEDRGMRFTQDDTEYLFIGQDYYEKYLYQDKKEFSENSLYEWEQRQLVPEGYIACASRMNMNRTWTHIFTGDFGNIGESLCGRAGTSLLRNRIGKKGLCPKCVEKLN